MLWILILGTLNIPQKDLLNKNNTLNIAFALSIEITLISLTTAPSLYLNIIYKRLILTAIYYIDFLVTIFDFYLTNPFRAYLRFPVLISIVLGCFN